MKTIKPTITYQEKYRKGTVLLASNVLTLINKNIDSIEIEINDRAVYSDKSESMTIKIKIK